MQWHRKCSALTALSIVVSTILVARVMTHASGYAPSPVIGGVQTHHWMYGLGLFYVGIVSASPPLSYVGLGLVVDEFDQVVAAMFPSYPPLAVARC
jgi:hypothetical protein